MKTATNTNSYHRNEALDHGTFKIANTAFMAEMLSDMYSDRIKAVIRELSTNAYDAHIQDGHNEPFEVHLPTTDQPYFSIRDFGSGLSKEDLKNLYTVYGYSSKRDSNDVVGCFGIGSKSPFAYTSMFTVISYFNGKKYTICNSKDANSKFCYDFLEEADTTESNGLEIKINVQNKDIYSFQSKGKDIYYWFKVKPKFSGYIPSYSNSVVTDSGDNWEINNHNKLDAVMGQVAYEINVLQFHGITSSVLSNCRPILYFGLGDIDITPSRESLKYTPKTIAAIENRCKNIYDVLKKQADDAIKNCKSLWEARLLAQVYFSGAQRYIGDLLNKKITFNGQTIESSSWLSSQLTNNLNLKSYKYEYSNLRESKKRVSVQISKNSRFAIADSPGAYAASKRFVEQNKDIILYVFTPYTIPAVISNNTQYCTPAVDINKKTLLDAIGILDSDLLLTSSFPKAAKGIAKTRVKRVKNVYQGYKYDISSQYWHSANIDLDNQHGIYCRIYRNHIEEKIPPRSGIINIIGNKLFVGLAENKTERFKNHNNWIHISDAIKTYLDNKMTPVIKKFWDVDINYELKNIYALKNKILPHSKIYSTLQELEEYYKNEKIINEYKHVHTMYTCIHHGLGKTYKIDSKPLKFSLFDKIPVLEFISYHNYNKPQVLEIINK